MKKVLILVLFFLVAALTCCSEKQNNEEETSVTRLLGTYDAKVEYVTPSISSLRLDKEIGFAADMLFYRNYHYTLVEQEFDEHIFDDVIGKDYKMEFSFPSKGMFAKTYESEYQYSGYVVLKSKSNKLYLFEVTYLYEYSNLSIIASYILTRKINNIVTSLYTLSGKEYGRLISSSNSKEDAVRVCTRHFTDTRYQGYENIVTDCSVIYESDILYGVNVKWYATHGGSYEENVISFKKDVVDMVARNVIYDEEESYKIYTQDANQMEKILLYIYFNTYFLNSVIYYDKTIDNKSKFGIAIYSYTKSIGDFGMENDTIYYYQTILSVDKTNGEVEFSEPSLLKTVLQPKDEGK